MKQKVALVLSGGGARGIAHIGVIDELEKHGYEITSVAGTSMGSLIGGIYAAGRLDAFTEWICSLDRASIFRMVDFTLSLQGLIKGDKALKKIKDFLPDTHIEDLSIPYAAVAADLINKEEVVFKSGSLYHAIRASIAIPSVLTPVKGNHSLLVDGGVLNNIPMDHVERTQGDMLVAVNVNADIPLNRPVVGKEEEEKKESAYQKKLKDFYSHLGRKHAASKEEKLSYFSLITRTIDLMTIHMAEAALELNPPDILIKVSRESCNLYDFYKAEEMVETGRQAALNTLTT
jgi:NTE family protein